METVSLPYKPTWRLPQRLPQGNLWNISPQESVLLTMYKIGGIEGFLKTSQLRWVGHVITMDDDRILKVLMYSQLSHGLRNVGRQWLWYKDKLENKLTAVNIPQRSIEAIANESWISDKMFYWNRTVQKHFYQSSPRDTSDKKCSSKHTCHSGF